VETSRLQRALQAARSYKGKHGSVKLDEELAPVKPEHVVVAEAQLGQTTDARVWERTSRASADAAALIVCP
jgi:hypothetical protein